MSKKSVLRFTLKELNALIQDEKARVVLQRSIRKLPLQPYSLSDLQGSIHEVLDANLAKFDHELKGILLSYKNIKIVKNIANVLYDDSRLYLTIQADFYLFRPEVGCVLRGIVNKRSADHVGCLVHKAFNVSIPRPECETDGDWQGYYVEIGQEVTFRVESLDLTGSLPYMLGCLLDVGSLSGPPSEIFDEQKTTEKEEIFAPFSKCNGFLEQHEDTHASVPTTEHKKKKKHKKYEDLESGGNVQDSVFVKHEKYDSIHEKDDEGHNESGSLLKTPKKKKRKNADQIDPIKQEEQTYRLDNDGGTLYQNQREEEQQQYEEKILLSKKQIDSSCHLSEFDHLNSTVNLEKKKRKYGEAFYDDDDDENHTVSTQNEGVKHKKKKSKKEKHVIEIANADEPVEDDFSIDTSKEITNQDKKRKKKNKRDVTGELSAELSEETTSPYVNNTPEELISKMQFSQEHLKKLCKKVKPLVTTELITSTPVEHKTNKENKFSFTSSTESHSGFKPTNLSESMAPFSLMHSPILKAKHTKKEKESSPAVQSDNVPVKVKKLKKEKRLSSTQQSPGKRISEDCQFSGSHCVSYHQESNLPCSDIENQTKGATTHLNLSNKSVTDMQETEHKNKMRESADKSSKQLSKSVLESPVESKVKINKKESHLSAKKKNSIGNEPKRTMKTDSNINDSCDNQDYGNNSYNQMVAQCGESGKTQMSNRLFEYMTNIEKQSSITRKSLTSSSVRSENTSEEGNNSDEDNVLKNILKLNRTPSSERSPKHKRVAAINQSSSQTIKNSDRTCSPDSGLSLSATSAEKDSVNLTIRDSKRDAHRMYSAEFPKDRGHVKEQAKILPKTPKRKKMVDTEEGGSHLTVKHRIKKEKESPVFQPLGHETDSIGPLREDGSLEAERMKILADMIKKLEYGNKEDLSMKDESHKPLGSSVVKARRKSKQEDTVSDSELDSSKSKKSHKRKESNKLKGMKSAVREVDNMQQLDATAYFKPSAEKLSSISTAQAGEQVLDRNRNNLGEGSPVTVQAKISGKTPRRKSTTETEASNSRPVTKTPVKIKKKDSPKKRNVMSFPESDNSGGNSQREESPGAMAERLLEEFVKRRSL
ncbi:titin homolog [Schistocerca piceifrons]|uniref:titin homolog n=1 Tax=Schistocerca piceifrons TaxID=274613 RepID=UPI001F5F35AE|nr:titin homolog [Schistocerca piceifrons]